MKLARKYIVKIPNTADNDTCRVEDFFLNIKYSFKFEFRVKFLFQCCIL